jgi:hypothetical protein
LFAHAQLSVFWSAAERWLQMDGRFDNGDPRGVSSGTHRNVNPSASGRDLCCEITSPRRSRLSRSARGGAGARPDTGADEGPSQVLPPAGSAHASSPVLATLRCLFEPEQDLAGRI